MKSALGVLVALLMTGCGAGDDPERAGERGGAFVAKVDALCKSANPQLASINAAIIRARDDARAGRAGPRETFGTFEQLLGRGEAVTDRLLARLRGISPPPDEEAFHADLVESLGRGAANVKRQIAAARRQDAAELRELSLEGSLLNARTKGLVAGHGGFRHCGRG